MVKLRKLDRQDVQNVLKQATLTGDTNPYEKALLSNRNLKRKANSQIEQWSILSDNIVYVKSEDKDNYERYRHKTYRLSKT